MTTRDRVLKNSLYKGVLWVIIGSMAGGSLLVSFFIRDPQTKTKKSFFASVNGTQIAQHEFDFRLAQEMEKAAYFRQIYNIPVDTFHDIVSYALISEVLLDNAANKAGIDLPSQYVVQKMNDPMSVMRDMRSVIPAQLVSREGKVDMQALHAYLRYRGISLSHFEQLVENSIRRAMVNNIATLAAVVTDAEVREAFMRLFCSHAMTIRFLSYDDLYNKQAQQPIAQDTLQKFFEQENAKNKRFWTHEQRTVSLIDIDPRTYGITIPESAIHNFYIKNKKSSFEQTPAQVEVRKVVFTIPEGAPTGDIEKKASQFYQEVIKNPAHFATFADTYQDANKVKAKGGHVGWIKRGDMANSELETALFNLKNDGDVTTFVRTDTGIEIYQRIAKKNPAYKPFEAVKQHIEQTLTAQEFKKQFVAQIAALDNNQEAYKDFIAKHTPQNSQKNTKPLTVTLDAAYKASPAKLNQKIMKAKKGAYFSLVNEEGHGIIGMVLTIDTSHEPSFESVKQEVKEAWLANKTQETIATELLNAKKGATLRAPVLFEGEITYSQEASIKALRDKGIPVDTLLPQNPQEGIVQTATDHKGNGYTVVVGKTGPWDDNLFEQKKNSIKKELYASKKEIIQRSFIASLYENATIQRNG